jgi:hypothetical protein
MRPWKHALGTFGRGVNHPNPFWHVAYYATFIHFYASQGAPMTHEGVAQIFALLLKSVKIFEIA